MGNPLLDRASPRELAERGQVIEKKEQTELFPRLTAAVDADLRSLLAAQRPPRWRQAPVAIRLAFAWADDRRELPAVSGEIVASVPAVCQRCLEPMILSLEQPLKLLLTGPDMPAASREGYETWEIDGPLVRPLDVVDESLLMAMPLAPVHGDIADCGQLAARLAPGGSDAVRPFADLRARMRKRD